MKAITEFRGPTRWLSNFHSIGIEYEGVVYPSVEHAYMAAKTRVPQERAAVLACATPVEAKKLGYKLTLRLDWEDVKVGIMTDLNMQKFANPELQDKLLATGDAQLIEGNNWGDRLWGAEWDEETSSWIGENLLGKILMEVRDFYYTRKLLLEIQDTLEFFEDFAGEVDDASRARATAALKRLREYKI